MSKIEHQMGGTHMMRVRTLVFAAIATTMLATPAFAQFDWKGLLSGAEKSVTIGPSLPLSDLSKGTSFGGGVGVTGVYPWKANIDGLIKLDVLYWGGDYTAIAVDWQALGRYNIGPAGSGMRPFVQAGIGLGRRAAFGSNAGAVSALDLGYTIGGGVNFGKLGALAQYQALGNWSWIKAGVSINF